MKTPNDPTTNETRDLLACSGVPQPIALYGHLCENIQCLILGSYEDGLLLYHYHPKLSLLGTFTVATQYKIFVVYWE